MSYSKEHLITANALNKTTNAVILDATFRLSTDPLNTHTEYQKQHIPTTQFFDIPAISDKTSSLPNMMPTKTHFNEYMTTLGITNDDRIVIYGQTGMVMGPARAWWMLKTFGHNNVQILDGGLRAWLASDLDTSDKPTARPLKNLKYQSRLNQNAIANVTDIQNAIDDKNTAIIDARSPKRYSGENEEPRKGLKAGHIPNSVNLPCSLFINTADKTLKPRHKIEEILAPYIKPNIITTCGSGVTACFLKYVLTITGSDSVKVYDGSWAEWGQQV